MDVEGGILGVGPGAEFAQHPDGGLAEGGGAGHGALHVEFDHGRFLFGGLPEPFGGFLDFAQVRALGFLHGDLSDLSVAR